MRYFLPFSDGRQWVAREGSRSNQEGLAKLLLLLLLLDVGASAADLRTFL